MKYWDDETRTPYAVHENKVITYDNERSMMEKVKFAMEKSLAGAMVWSIDTDDFHGDCSEDSGDNFMNFPLMRSINKGIEVALEEIKRDKENIIPHGKENDQSKANRFSNHFMFIIFFATFVCFY